MDLLCEKGIVQNKVQFSCNNQNREEKNTCVSNEQAF